MIVIMDAELPDGIRADVGIAGGQIVAIGQGLPGIGGVVIEAQGGALLPGLHDHHIHLFALAASFSSVDCGPNLDGAGLAARLRAARGDWVRGVGYHEQVAGRIDRHWLDDAVPDRPVRVQHRSGRLWIFNSAALARLDAEREAGFERGASGQLTGRLFDGDDWLRRRMRAGRPDLSEVSRRLAARGVTGVTDVTPGNDLACLQALRGGEMKQHVHVMGQTCLLRAPEGALGVKLHLHEGDYPAPESVVETLRAADKAGLQVAVHCVTEGDVVFCLSLVEEADIRGVRMEHASMVPPSLMPRIREAGMIVVTQPNFVAERGDAYLRDIPKAEHAWLYRCASWHQHGVRVGGGTDAPFGHFDPWRAMQAAVGRRTASGAVLGRDEAVSPEAALALFTTPAKDPGGPSRRVAVGEAADLCLLSQGWQRARRDLASVRVMATLRGGEIIHNEIEGARHDPGWQGGDHYGRGVRHGPEIVAGGGGAGRQRGNGSAQRDVSGAGAR